MFAQNMLLTEHLVQGLGPQKVCQRLVHSAASFLLFPSIAQGEGKCTNYFLYFRSFVWYACTRKKAGETLASPGGRAQ